MNALTQMPTIGVLLLVCACGQQKPRGDLDGAAGNGGHAEVASAPGEGGGGGTGSDGVDARAESVCHARTPASVWAMWRMPNPLMDGLPNSASYTDVGDGTVCDNVTRLVWQRDVPEGGYSWVEANDYCRSLSLAGGGWRLPTRIELVSLVDFSRPSPGPTIDTAAFPETPSETFWSSSRVPETAVPGMEFAWYVNFYSGAASNELPELRGRVRCVR